MDMNRYIIGGRSKTWPSACIRWLLAGLVAVLAVVAPRRAPAAQFGGRETILDSMCTSQESQIPWWGGVHAMSSPLGDYPRGTVWVCWREYRIEDEDRSGDYYAVVATSFWISKNERHQGYPAAMHQSITSDVDGVEYHATRTVSTNEAEDCTVGIPIEIPIRFLKVSTEIKFCPGYSLKQIGLSSRGASWHTDRAGGMRQVETMFIQQVPEGVRPRFTVSFGIPQYNNEWDDPKGRWISSSHLVWQTFSTDPGGQKWWVDTFEDAPGHSAPGGPRTGTLKAGTNYVYCKKQGPMVQIGGARNHWWLQTDLDSGNPTRNQWVSAYYLKRWGDNEARDNNGTEIPDCK